MNITRTKLRNNWIYITCILILGLLSVVMYISIAGINNAKDAEASFANFYYQENKARVKREVETRLDEITTIRKEIESFNNESIQHEIKHMAFILEGLDLVETDEFSIEEIAANEFSQMAIFDRDLYYFAFKPDGTVLSHGGDQSLKGTNLNEQADADGYFFINDMKKAVDMSDGIMVTYKWPKYPETRPMTKTSYCYYIEKYNLVIATGIYYEDIESELKETVYNTLQNYYEDREDYMFVHTFEGVAEVASNRSLVGNDYSMTKNADGKNIHAQFMSTVETGGGYVTYYFYEKNSNIKSEKVSYTTQIPGWNSYIAMGFYTRDLKSVISAYSDNYRKDHHILTLNVAIAMTVVVLFTFIFIQRGIGLIKVYMANEEGMFTQLIQMVNDGVIIVNRKKSILYVNKKAKTYFGNELYPYFTSRSQKIEEVDNNVYKISTNDTHTYYVEITKKNIVYDGQDCIIHLVKNITSHYIKSHKYEQMSYIDSLTSLPNRRALQNDFDGLISSETEDNFVVGMIDIDLFKNVNDTFGHDFGDEILILLSNVFKEGLRSCDNIYRYGGEEFVVLLSDITDKDAKHLIEEIKTKYSEEAYKKFNIQSTFSGGLKAIEMPNDDIDIKYVMRQVDRLLYTAKESGRNKILI